MSSNGHTLNRETVRRRLAELGMTQVELAEFVGRTANTVWNWLDGRTTPGTMDIARIAEFLGIGTRHLVHEDGVVFPNAEDRGRRVGKKLQESLDYALSSEYRKRQALSLEPGEGATLKAVGVVMEQMLKLYDHRFVCGPWVDEGYARTVDLRRYPLRAEPVVSVSIEGGITFDLDIGFGVCGDDDQRSLIVWFARASMCEERKLQLHATPEGAICATSSQCGGVLKLSGHMLREAHELIIRCPTHDITVRDVAIR